MKRPDPKSKATKLSQCFFCLDLAATQARMLHAWVFQSHRYQWDKRIVGDCPANTRSPAWSVSSGSRSASISPPSWSHISVAKPPFDLLVPFPAQPSCRKRHQELTDEDFTSRWAGFATAVKTFTFREHPDLPLYSLTQRIGEDQDDYHYRSFLSTGPIDEVKALSKNYPGRWGIEEIFNLYQDIGWKRSGTMNFNIRYGSMTMALIAQAAIYQLRQRVGDEISTWNSQHLAQSLFQGLDGNLRIKGDTIIVTLYNAERFGLSQNAYKNLPQQLEKEGVAPRVPWLFGSKIDFRFC